jgi:tRNA 2-thiouridine synthesizing protein E
MSVENVAGTSVELDDDGCLLHAEDWNDAVAADLAAREGITLTADHWRVLRYVRRRYLDGERPPTMRVVSRACGISTRDMFRLFPQRPLHVAAKAAGVPEPHDYIGGCGSNWWSRWR